MNSAIISECGLYRYRLERSIRGWPTPTQAPVPKVFAYFGINPSTADASLDDSTVRKWTGFTMRNGGSKFIVGNVFAFRATDPKKLGRVDDPFGPECLEHLTSIIADADILVPCWGNLTKMPPDLRGAPAQLMAWLKKSGKPILHFGTTKSGQPKHPLMLGYDTPLTPWSAQ